MKKLSDRAWEKAATIIQAIKSHPFNRELASGSLEGAKFAYYIEQDTLYLQDFAKSLALIAARVPVVLVRDFLSLSEGALIAEQEVVHGFFRDTFRFTETGNITPATLSYTSYLLQTSALACVEVAIAAVLPCFWVYREVGLSIAASSTSLDQNPYARWIETYSGPEFAAAVQKAIAAFDTVALTASEATREAMLEAFYKSTVLEWHFWNDAYHQAVFDVLLGAP
jgi:thiaminase/transcriptional activator TenA